MFDSECPKLIYGFVTLAKVFFAVDESFIAAWMDQQGPEGVDSTAKSSQSVSKILSHDCTSSIVSPSEIDEIQHLDITVTQHWLRVLACQLHMRGTAQYPSIVEPQGSHNYHAQCVIDTSRSLLYTISVGTPKSLEAHGIGMVCHITEALSTILGTIGPRSHPQITRAPTNLSCH